MNRERKICRQRYYDSKVSQLKECKPSAWWNEVKKLGGMSSAVRDSNELMRSLQHTSEEPLSASDLANVINDTFLSPMQDFTPLSAETFQLPQDHSTPHQYFGLISKWNLLVYGLLSLQTKATSSQSEAVYKRNNIGHFQINISQVEDQIKTKK